MNDPQDISEVMDGHQAGDTISVTVVRGRKQMTLKLMLGEAKGRTLRSQWAMVSGQ